ncbi:hypothetical protein BG004_005453 [Podila humilis]|nr:hypothetical protein BG004_005453 [Podila humilis]
MSIPSAPRLPPECIVLVARHLLREDKAATVQSLLLASKSLFALVAPILYKNPFRDQRILQKLCRLLLRNHSVNQLSDVLKMAYFPELYLKEFNEDGTDQEASSSVVVEPLMDSLILVNYCEFIKHIHVNISSVVFQSRDPFPKDVLSSLLKHTKAILDSGPRQPVRFWVRGEDPRPMNLLCHLLTVDLTWTLSEPILEQLQQITMPLSDITRYHLLAHRLCSLTTLDISIDFLDSFDAGKSNEEISAFRKEQFERAVLFVKELVCLHGKRIREVRWLNSFNNIYLKIECPQSVQDQVMLLLPPLDKPTWLDEYNWRHFVAHAASSSVEKVKRICTPNFKYGHVDLDKDGIQLRQCRALEELTLNFVASSVSFQWAAQEKANNIRTMPLRILQIHQYVTAAALDIDDAASAFSGTLQIIQYDCDSLDSSDMMSFDTTVKKAFVVGNLWPQMSALEMLVLRVSRHLLIVDPNMLSCCPNLSILTVRDAVTSFNPVTRVWHLPLTLPRLINIELTGSGAMGFNMDTFKTTPLVQSIYLSMTDSGYCDGESEDGYEYDIDLLNGPMQWSWDWYLPRLRSMTLCSGFASLFEFRMLEGCPELVTLQLLVSGSEFPPEGRVLNEADLCSRREEDSEGAECVWCPRLTLLHVQGRWSMTGPVLQKLFEQVMPNLEHLSMSGCRGHNSYDWFKATMALRSLDEGSTDLNGLENEAVLDLGLQEVKLSFGSHFSLNKDPKRPVRFLLSGANGGRYQRKRDLSTKLIES